MLGLLLATSISAKPIKITIKQGLAGYDPKRSWEVGIDVFGLGIKITKYYCKADGDNCPGIVSVSGVVYMNNDGTISEQAMGLVSSAVTQINKGDYRGRLSSADAPFETLIVLEQLTGSLANMEVPPSVAQLAQYEEYLRSFKSGVYVFWNYKTDKDALFVIIER